MTSFTCPHCKRTSHNPNDAAKRFCGACGYVDEVHRAGGILLPPAPGKCQTCAVAHDAEDPHNKDSLYYQMKFRSEQGRWPTWRDAIAHCAPEMREAWEDELRKLDAWDGWEGDTPPAPDVAPTPGRVGTVQYVAEATTDSADHIEDEDDE